MLRLAGELPIGRVLNDLQPLLILHIFCMKGLASPPTDPPWLYASVSRTAMCHKRKYLTTISVVQQIKGHLIFSVLRK
ncbi:hypothetical protein E6D37_11200 [Escherichia coli]|nr:hypothetical protein [Escherichia coli]